MMKPILSSVILLVVGAAGAWAQPPRPPAGPPALPTGDDGSANAFSGGSFSQGPPPGPDGGPPGGQPPLTVEDLFPPIDGPYLAAVSPFEAPTFWATAEALFWRVKSNPVPVPLLTSGPPDVDLPGGINEVETVVVFGQRDYGFGDFTGGRLRFGMVGGDTTPGFDIGGFLLEENIFRASAYSDTSGNPIFSRPFFDVPSYQDQVNLLSLPDQLVGGLTVLQTSRLWGAEANLAYTGMFAGFRYLDLQESLSLSDIVTTVEPGLSFFGGQLVQPGDVRFKEDRYDVHNRFYGGQVGAKVEGPLGSLPVIVGVRAAVAVGVNRERVSVSGETTLAPRVGEVRSLPGGLLSVPPNVGTFETDKLAVVPEVEINVGLPIGEFARVWVGYSALWWSAVARPGEQVNVIADQTQIPIAPNFNPELRQAGPAPPIKNSPFWAYGITVGFGLTF